MSKSEILTHILLADDLILIAESSKELQTLLDNVFEYCKRWHLLVNLTKTKVMIINGSKKESYKFYYSGVLLEIIHKYKYLGVVVSDTGNHFSDQIDYVEAVANRAVYSVQGYLYSLNQMPPPISMKLFDSLVAPILEYGSEIWSLCNSYNSLETLYLRFMKSSLGVRPQTTTVAVMGELGRYPLSIRLQVKAVKFWCKLVSKPSKSLPGLAYKMLLDLKESGFATWIDKIYDILCVCELENVFYSEYFSTSDIYRITSLVRTSLQHQYVDKWKDEIQTKPKLRTYKLFKTTFFIEPYLYLSNPCQI